MSDGKDLTRAHTRSLSRIEFDEVIRRAAELAMEDGEGTGPALSEVELFRIASEVGLPAEHVRAALAEVRTRPLPTGTVRALMSAPWVRASRVIPTPREEVGAVIDEFMVSGRLLQRVRQGSDTLVYWPAVDWASQVARAASSTGRKYYIASAKRVEVELRRVDDANTFVELAVDPGIRDSHLWGAGLGGLSAGGASGTVLTLLLTGMVPFLPAVALGVVGGVVATVTVGWAVGRSYREQMDRVRLEMEGVLDQLERGQSLEPPPPAWRKWVARHFHGVARDVFGADRDEKS